IENDGTEPLEIFSISHASCCSIFDYILEQDIIESCERTSLTISFDPINSLGDLKELAFINSNDPEHPRIPVYIQAKVFAPLVIIPRRCVFSNPDKEQDHRTLIMKMNKNEELALSNIKASSEALRVEIIPIEKDFLLNVFLDRRKLPSGEKKQNLYLILFLDSSIESKEVKIPVIVNP
ncbi:hypothetical protein JW926_09390, partial [Candidatus Sumerlaeota bacterium]|nr:hypothetical protein [Candidatus Sumerlaeota bacterium]